MHSSLITAGCPSPHKPLCMRQQQHPPSLPHRIPQQQQPVPAAAASSIAKALPRATKPDRGSLAALEAAVGAINGILGAHSNRQKQKQQKQQKGPGSAPPAQAGPSKLISFSAKASGSVPVKEWFKIRDDPVDTHSSSSSASSSSSSSSSASSSSASHKPSSRQQQLPVPSKPPALSDWVRTLQAYLSLPLEQYSVLDPSLITRLPPGTDTELLLTKLLAARKERREQQQAAAAAAKAAAQAADDDDGSSSSSSNGTSLEPKMRQLEEAAAAAAEADSSNNNGVVVSSSDASTNGVVSTIGSSQNSHHAAATAATAAAAAAAAAGADAGEAGGCFLLRIPMQELVGIPLEPLLIISVDIDPVHGQVKFRASRLVVGDPRFDEEFKVDLQATMSSKITKQPHIVHASADHGPPPPAPGAVPAGSTSSTSTSSSGNEGSGSISSSSGVADIPSSSSGQAAAVAVAESSPAGVAAAQQQPQHDGQHQQQQQDGQHQQQQALYWQRTSALSCKVNLSMTLRLPHPLSIVPGPLLSTTAGLVARLVMQSLLPSFLELLATDYGRWATGSSRAAPVGSLVAAGKQYLKSPPGQPQSSSSSS